MRAGYLVAAALLLVVSGCAQPRQSTPVAADVAGLSNRELTRFLPTLADYPGPSWDLTLTAGASNRQQGPYIDPSSSVEPAECAAVPFLRSDLVAASSDGVVQNGIAGDAGSAAVRIMRERPGVDLIAESLAWAKRCREYRISYSNFATAPGAPTAISVLPPRQVEGAVVTRIHFTDNRAKLYQGEGSRESVVSLARVHGLVVVGYHHDRAQEAAAILALTIRRLSSNHVASKPSSDKPDTSALNQRTDKELEQLLPSVTDAPDGWTILQSSPIIAYSTQDGESATGCSRLPFANEADSRSDTRRDFRQIATVSAASTSDGTNVRSAVTIGLEIPDVSVITETTLWANQCGLEALPTPPLDGIAVTSFRIRERTDTTPERTVSLLKVRKLLVITEPALTQQKTQLAHQSIENLLHAQFATAPTGPDPMPTYPDPHTPPPGYLPLPEPTVEATTTLARVGQGTLVNSEPYHMGGYMPGDSLIRSPDDYLHFHSPSGAITCDWRKYTLICDTPHGTYPRTPKPADLQGIWQDSVSILNWYGLISGTAGDDPIVYAVSNVLPYGSTLRLTDDTECRMDRDGLTCVDYAKRIGLHLSRTDLTPLAATKALTNDTRPQPTQ